MMFLTAPASGHFFPLVPIASAVRREGHAAIFVSTGGFADTVRAAGHESLAFGPDRHVIPPEVLDETALEALSGLVQEWAPDVIVHDHVLAPAAIVADSAGVPNAYSAVGIMRSPQMMQALRQRWDPLWRRRGLDVPDDLGLHRYLYLDRCPPSLQLDAARDIPVAHPIRPTSWDGAKETEAPILVDGSSRRRPVVYVTLGTEFNSLPVMGRILNALTNEPVDVIATVGSNRDPADLGERPSHIRVERYLPQSEVLARADVVVCHGGSGTIMGSLSAGIPMLLLPQGADQVDNAPRCVTRGVACSLSPSEAVEEAIRRSVGTLLTDDSYRNAALEVAHEIELMPTPDRAVDLLLHLGNTQAPVTR